MISRIQAAESLRRSAEVAVGNGTLKEDEGKRITREWLSEANAGNKETKPRLTKNQMMLKLASMGIGVVECPAKD